MQWRRVRLDSDSMTGICGYAASAKAPFLDASGVVGELQFFVPRAGYVTQN